MMHTYRSLPMTNAVTFPAIQLWLNCPLLLSARYKKVPNQYFQLSFPQVKSSSCINHENQIKILWQKGHISSSWWGTTAWWVGFSLGPCLLTPTKQCNIKQCLKYLCIQYWSCLCTTGDLVQIILKLLLTLERGPGYVFKNQVSIKGLQSSFLLVHLLYAYTYICIYTYIYVYTSISKKRATEISRMLTGARFYEHFPLSAAFIWFLNSPLW